MPASQQKPINFNIMRIDAEGIRQVAGFQATILTDVTGRRGALRGCIKPPTPYMAVAGPVIAVEIHPGDNLAIHVVMAVAKPGGVPVIDGRDDFSCALLGEIMATQIQVNGIAGVIIDGTVYDAETLSNQRFPVFAAGLNPRGPTKFTPGRVSHAISVGGATMQTDDLVVGDIDGMVVIPHDEACIIIELAKGKLAMESKRLVAIRDGDLRPHWLENALCQAGILSEGETLP